MMAAARHREVTTRASSHNAGVSPCPRLDYASSGTFQAATNRPSALPIAIARAPTIAAAGSSTRAATSSCDSANVEQARDRLLHPRLLRCAPEDAEHLRRREPEEERDTLMSATRCEASESGGALVRAGSASRSANVMNADASASDCMRRRATVGCARPAVQRLHAETIESTVQWMKKTMINREDAGRPVLAAVGIVAARTSRRRGPR